MNLTQEQTKGLILFADDDMDTRESISRLLEHVGYCVKTVSDGNQALDFCKETLPDLLLSDVIMPGLDGLGLLQTLRSNQMTATLPIILVSACAGQDAKMEAILAGADDYLTKPLHAAELVARIDGAVKLGKLRYDSEQFYRTVCSSVYEAIIILKNNFVVDCNDMASKLFETTKNEFIGMNILNSTYHFECRGNDFLHYLTSASEGSTRMECSLLLGNNLNKTKYLDMTLSRFGTDPNKMILIARDITEKLEEEKLFKMQARQAQLGEMISMIAHQWRQPLSIINAIAAQIRLKELMKEQGDFALIDNLIKIEQQCVHLSQTISDYRDLSSPNKEKEDVTFSKLIHHAISLLDHTFKDKGIEVHEIIRDDVILKTFYNEVLQVLITLLKNSVDACEENNRYYTITITVDHDEEYGIIKVHDKAGGISTDLVNKLFTPYFTTKNKKNGTGLGLYMSKMIIEDHCKGLLEVSSEGQETLFSIKLPKQ
ncbi:response regulator [Sulfuricurvum sp.]|uniref:response regulator n=1 Tax=Sulfuricurvum sp. TaxID=2025608 RepID=UPI003C3BC8C6